MHVLSNIKRYRYILLISLLFAFAYSVLSLVRHAHYQSFGYDLGIVDQITWNFSRFQLPITTIDDVPFSLSLTNHFELIYAFLSPLYWLWDNVSMLLIAQSVVFCSSAIAVYLFAKKNGLRDSVAYALSISYLAFFGVQNALWFDVHSAPFATAFLMWFIYYVDRKAIKSAVVFFILCITAKENYAAYVMLVNGLWFLLTRERRYFYFLLASLLYTGFLFGIYFPRFVEGGYHYAHGRPLFQGFNILDLVSTYEKRQVFLYSLLSYGFLPLLFPLYLIPFIGNLVSYFVLGRDVTTAQGLFLQYRIDLAPLLIFATVLTIARLKFLNRRLVALYIIICIVLVQYLLHLPLSYLTKRWFWQTTPAVKNIDQIISFIPSTASLTAQNNIISHLSHRQNVFTLWPRKKVVDGLTCPKVGCDWLFWAGQPEYLVVDTSSEWDIRHYLVDPANFRQALLNQEKAGVIKKYKTIGTARIYRIVDKTKR